LNPLAYVTSALRGTPRALREHASNVSSAPCVASGLAMLRTLSKSDAAEAEDNPIFLLSAGWRAGSTLLQRLIMSDPGVLMWGEPYDECGPVQRMAEMLKAFRPGWPPNEYYHSGAKPRSGEWVANYFPDADALRRGHRAFFDAALAQPARQAGARRWGLKEVRLGVEHAHYLRWLYPACKLVFLYRNPLEAYQSYCRFGRNWYDLWPEKPVFTPEAFGRHWRELAAGFLRDAPDLGALVVRYEELVSRSPQLLERIEGRLEVRLDASVLAQKVGSSERGGEHAHISRLEKNLLRKAVSPLAEQLGYQW
jgi:hypothetical protein